MADGASALDDLGRLARRVGNRPQTRTLQAEFALTHDHHTVLMAMAADGRGHGFARMRRPGELRGREFQQPFNGRHAHTVGKVMELLPGVDEQLHNRQKLLAASREEFGDSPLAGIAVGNVRLHRVVSLERGLWIPRILT